MTEKTLDGRIALVTGASRGIGAATAEALAAAGAHVVITARTAAGLEEVEERIHQAGGSATIAPLDLIDGDSIGRLAQAVTERWGKLDTLVLNAAMLGTLTPVVDIDPKELAKVLTLNVGAQQALLAAFDPLLRKSDTPRVIALTSRVGAVPTAFWGAYGASKAALDNLLLTYAAERKQVGNVRVAIVDPGATATKMRARAFPGEDQSTLKSPEVVADAIAALVAQDFETGHRIRVG
ncbi:NAD(P)-dependent dehydrogenase (short-subunit alcohol dehydrogenase family) [Sphingomonas zeicaulis]|uniref:SDR family NAD(P)-dependent oxidoreductase n=1 Tax=Sphingomonas zeicaulis TaxID=1632740 RepID=UPI003D24A0A0